MRDLLIEYRKTRLKVLNKIEELEQINTDEIDDLSVYKDMLKDIDYTIEWLNTGHEPGNYNAIDKSQCYLVDQQVLEKACDESMYKKISNMEYHDVIDDMDNQISYALMKLTTKELECFIMIRCEHLSYRECADLLNIKIGTVQNFLKRAQKKIDNELKENLFLL